MYNLLIYKIEKPQKPQKISIGLNPKTKNPISANPAYIVKIILIYYCNYFII